MKLKDIAKEAGVSIMTVSNVINGKHSKVSASTIERVNKIIDKYNYAPNMTAKSLSQKSSKIVAVIISISEEDEQKNYLENPFVSTIIGITEKLLRQNGYYAMVCSIKSFEDVLKLLDNWNLDGIMFLNPIYTKEIENHLAGIKCPILVFDGDTINRDMISVNTDDEKGLYLSTRHLIEKGHKHIAFVANYDRNPLLTRRFSGYLKALNKAGIPINKNYIFEYSPNYEEGVKAGKYISSYYKEITGVVTTADMCAIGIMEGAKLCGYNIPDDLSVVGFDDLKLCSYVTPKLTSISQQIDYKTKIGITTLIDCMNAKKNIITPIVIDVKLVKRQSVRNLIFTNN
ncbi:MAG: LacI family transcriptional regulator [Candidatus Epulonipiscium fishelsonii]|nr:MAG: LacI family transcriptional regulator [Epulopiscium sp. AS2M-Bin002]